MAQRLIQEGVHVIAIDREGCDSHLPQSPLIRFYPCEMRSLEQVTLPKEEPDAFYHFAWQGVVPEYRENFEIQYENVGYCLSAVRLAARMGAGMFVLPGSTLEYFNASSPIDASICPASHNAYGSAKTASRFLSQILCQALGVSFTYSVIASLYGVGREDNNVIFYVIRSLLVGQRPNLTRMEQRWDFIHILDAVDALYKIGCLKEPSSFYAIGNGDNWPLKDYVSMVRDLIDPR
jgi:nucleoside-diphosphate-sugar epimerase